MFATLLKKDFATLYRERRILGSSCGLAMLLTTIASLALHPVQVGSRATPEVVSGVVWIVFLFSSVAILNHSLLVEREGGGMLATFLSGVDGGSIFLSKWCANAFSLALVALVTVIMVGLLLGLPHESDLFGLTVVIGIALAAISALGTLLAAVATLSQARELLLPILLVSLLLPLIGLSVTLSRDLLSGADLPVSEPVFLVFLGAAILACSLSFLMFHELQSE